MPRHHWLFLAITHGVNLVDRSPLEQQHPSHRLSTAITEGNVVFAATALIGVPFEAHTDFTVTGDKITVGFENFDRLAG